MTSREIFDKVKKHLLKQGERSSEDGWCLYRSGDLKCAVGCLIPDDLYKEDMERTAINGLFNKFYGVMKKIGLKHEHKNLLVSLQNIHDTAEPIHWETNLNRLEEMYFKGE